MAENVKNSKDKNEKEIRFRKNSLEKKRLLVFAAVFSIIGAATLFIAGASNEVRTAEAESLKLSDGATIANDASASSGKFVSFKDALDDIADTGSDTGSDSNNTPQACNPNRTVTVADEQAQNNKIGYNATKTKPTNTEKNQIQAKIQNEINRFIDREISRGRIYKKNGLNYLQKDNSIFEPFQTIIGSVGIVQTNTERNPLTGWSVKSFGSFQAESHVGRFDPIVAPCQSTFGHEHVFFGNTKTDGFSTTSSLFNQKSILHPVDPAYMNKTYKGEWIADSASYWMPTVYKNGKRLVVENLSFYYFATGKTSNRQVEQKVQPMPLGLRMIAGDANYNGSKGGCKAIFQQFDIDSNNTCGNTQMISMPSNKKLEFTIFYPSCWDGKRLNTPDQSHVAYPSGGKSNTSCPSSHPVMIPQLQMIGNFKEAVTAGDSFELSSGSWKTFHADFWNAWDPALMKVLTEQVINAGRSAGGIHAALPN